MNSRKTFSRLHSTLWLFAIALSCATVTRANSLHQPWEWPTPYAGSGSAYAAQAAPGATVFFRAQISEREPYWTPYGTSATYQWYFNDVPLAGETGWSLTLRNVSAANTGNYSVRWTLGGLVNQTDYFPLNVVAPPATPLESAPQLVPVSGFSNASVPVASFPDGRSIFAHYSLRDGLYYGSIVAVRADGVVDYQIRVDTNGPPVPSFLPSGRYLRSTQPIAGMAELVHSPSYMMRAIEELPDGRVIGVAVTFSGTNETVFRLNADFTLDPTFDSAANAFRANATAQSSRFLVWQGRQLVALRADGSPDATFTPLSIDATWPELAGIQLGSLMRTVQPIQDGTVLVAITPVGYPPTTYKFVRLAANGTPLPGTAGATPGTGGPRPGIEGDFYIRETGRNGTWRVRTAGPLGDDPTFYAGVEATTGDPWDWFLPRSEGGLLVGKFTPAGVVLARLRTTDIANPVLPAVISTRVDPIAPGARVVIDPRVLGAGPLTYQWVSLDGGTLPEDTTSRTLVFDSFQGRNVGHYQVRITGPGGTYLSPVYRLVPDYPVRLLALSGRGMADAEPGTLIAGWASRSGSMLLARGVGPTLGSYGVTQFAADPVISTKYLTNYNGASNDNWSASLVPLFQRLGASSLLANSKDAAVEVPSYELGTLLVQNPAGRGIALAEIYDSTSDDPQRIHLNALSLRGIAGQNEQALIGGFVLDDPAGYSRPLRMLIRVVGPTLANYGVPQPIANPVLKLYNAQGNLLAQNDDWETGTPQEVAAVKAATERVGLTPHPAGSRDSSLYVELPPGAYTVHATGATGGTGTALIEIYRVD